MNILYILGSIGGIFVLIRETLRLINSFGAWHREYRRMKAHWERDRDKNVKMPMGFTTAKERAEIEDRLTSKRGA